MMKKDNSWFVKYQDYTGWGLVEEVIRELPLHPDNMNQIKEYEKIFDNMDGRILSNPKVKFDIVDVIEEGGKTTVYAKLNYL